MKLLVADSARADVLGGTELALLDLAVRADRAGHSVHLVGRPGSRFWRGARDRGLSAQELPMRGSLDLPTALRLRLAFRRRGTDVALAALTRDLRLLGLARMSSRGPAIAILHGLPMLRDNWSHALTYRWFADGVLAPTRWLAQVARLYGYMREIPVEVAPDGIDDSAYPGWADLAQARREARARAGIPAASCLLFSAGSLIARKNFGFLLPLLAEMQGGWEWWIAGAGPGRAGLESLIRSSGLEGRVRLLGDRADVMELLLACDALLAPSTSEQLPLVVLEAVRAGVPRMLISGSGAAEELGELGATVLAVNDSPRWAAELRAAITEQLPARIPQGWDRGADLAAGRRLAFLESLTARKGR